MDAKLGGDSWRWNIARHARPSSPTIRVIDGPPRPEPPKGARKVPFGFGIREPEPEWLGNPS